MAWVRASMPVVAVRLVGSPSIISRSTAAAVGMSPEPAVASNASGGVTAKMISPQSLSVATAATNMVGQEGNLFRFTIGHSIAMTLVLCVLTYLQAGPLSFMLP